MRINTAKRRMLDGKPAIGASLTLGSPQIGEIISQMNFDHILVDCQHGLWDEQGAATAFRNIALGSAVPMARVHRNDFGAIGRLLDLGAMGIVVPMVETVEQAQAAAEAARYPPRGRRSAGALGARFHGPDYLDWFDDELFLAVQIEAAAALERVEEIMAVDGIDGCWIGPADLRITMGVDIDTQEGAAAHEAAILKVLEACRSTGKIPGIATGEDVQRRIDQGFLYVMAGGDYPFILRGAEEFLAICGREP
jgi:4-hydroxy-2-oxoheptanedioate aldolase